MSIILDKTASEMRRWKVLSRVVGLKGRAVVKRATTTVFAAIFLFGTTVCDGQGISPLTNSGAGAMQSGVYDLPTSATGELFGYASPVRVGMHLGENYSARNSFTSLEVFKPLTNSNGSGSEAFDYIAARIGVFEGGGTLANLGYGVRAYRGSNNTFYDANIWYDADNSHENFFQQITAGGQFQSHSFIARGHYYYPFDDTQQFSSFTPVQGTVQFSGQNLAVDRFRIDEVAMHGLDIEAGIIFPTENVEYRALGGYYNFSSDTDSEFDGFSGRLLAIIGNACTLGVQVTHDDVHQTGVLGTIAWNFSSARPVGNSIRHRLGDQPFRNFNVTVNEEYFYDPLFLSNVNTGDRLRIIHAASGGGGAGTVQSPFSQLSDVVADMTANGADAIFVHADSSFNGQSIVLPGGARLLGEGLTHTIETLEMGTVTLPRATTGSSLPVLFGSTGAAAITMTSDNEVNGLIIRNALGDGIAAAGSTGTSSITNVTVDGAAGTGLALRGGSAIWSIENLTVNNADLGIDVDTTAGGITSFSGTTTVNGYTTGGVQVTSPGTVSFSTLNINNTSGSVVGRGLQVNGLGTYTFNSVNVTDTNRTANGVEAVRLSGNGAVTVAELNIETNNGAGLVADSMQSLTISGGTISSNGGTAVSLNDITRPTATFDSVSATNTAIGLNLTNGTATPFGSITIAGAGTAGSGGIMSNVDQGVFVDGFTDVSLNHMTIDSSVTGVHVRNTNGLNLNAMRLSSTSDNWVGLNHISESGNTSRPITLTSNTVLGSGLNQTGLSVTNDQGLPELTATVLNNVVSLTGLGSTGLNILATGNGLGLINDGGIILTGSLNNTSTATTPFDIRQEASATIDGQIEINGVMVP